MLLISLFEITKTLTFVKRMLQKSVKLKLSLNITTIRIQKDYNCCSKYRQHKEQLTTIDTERNCKARYDLHLVNGSIYTNYEISRENIYFSVFFLVAN